MEPNDSQFSLVTVGSLKKKSSDEIEGPNKFARLTEADLPTLVRMDVEDAVIEDVEDLHSRLENR